VTRIREAPGRSVQQKATSTIIITEIKKDTQIFFISFCSSTPKTSNKQESETTKHYYTVSNTYLYIENNSPNTYFCKAHLPLRPYCQLKLLNQGNWNARGFLCVETFIYEASGILEIHTKNNILKTSFNIYNMYKAESIYEASCISVEKIIKSS
jgi:hypothetical protein